MVMVTDRFVRLPFKTTQLFLFIAVIVGAGMVNIVTLYHTHRYMGIFDRSLVGYHSIQRLHSELETSVTNLRLYVHRREESHREAFTNSRVKLDRLFSEVLRYNLTGIAASFELRAIDNGLKAYFEVGDRAVHGASANDPGHYQVLMRAGRISDFVFIYIQRLMHIRLSEGLETHAVLRGHARAMGAGALFGILAMGVLLMLFLIVFTRRITRPVRKLAAAAYRMAHGELDIGEVVVSSVEEIDVLAEAFNRMNRNINSLVNDLKDKSALERKLHREELKNVRMERSLEHARFQQLQAQINPHFLFNSLNAISRAALFEHAAESARLIQSLAQLLRHSLGTRSSMSPLDRELQIVREYVRIQEYRFRERLKFELLCDPDLQEVQVPCFSIQPLVENAVQHGIEPLESGGEVRVRVRRRNGRVRISVEDSGTGMTTEQLNTVFEPAQGADDAQATGIGLANVRERLCLMYHDQARFEIRSEVQVGTTVIIEIPELSVPIE